MIEYIKMLIIALFTSATLPLPASSAAHYSLVNGIVGFSSDNGVIGFYYSVIALVFSLVAIIMLRKIYVTAFSSIRSKDESLGAYRRLIKNLLISFVPLALLFIPAGEDKLLIDYFDVFLSGNFLIIAIISLISALYIALARWYARQSYSTTIKGADLRSVLRMTFYQLISYVVPGVSHMASGSANLLMCDVESKVIIREIYVYIAPQMLAVNIIKLIRYALSDIVVEPVMLIIAIAASAPVCVLVISKMSKINIRRLLRFFAIYTAVFGVFAAILSFIL